VRVYVADVTEAAHPTRPIPADVKRRVRQRCGFGCVICGLPIYEYDHMEGWAETHRHVAEEITLLCDRHHREKTVGLLPLERVVSANENPFNITSGVSSPYSLHYSGGSSRIVVGGNESVAEADADHFGVLIDGVVIVGFRFEDGQALLNMQLFDELNDLALQIFDNELIYSSGPWDIEFTGRRLIIRSEPRDIFIDTVFEVPSTVRIERGRLLLNGVELKIRPDSVLLVNTNATYSGGYTEGPPAALSVGVRPPGIRAAFSSYGVPRYRVERSEAAYNFDVDLSSGQQADDKETDSA
jgi:hypothetical protein